MESNKMVRINDERRVKKHREDDSNVAATAWKVVGVTLAAVALAAVVVSLPDLKRYIKISTM